MFYFLKYIKKKTLGFANYKTANVDVKNDKLSGSRGQDFFQDQNSRLEPLNS